MKLSKYLRFRFLFFSGSFFPIYCRQFISTFLVSLALNFFSPSLFFCIHLSEDSFLATPFLLFHRFPFFHLFSPLFFPLGLHVLISTFFVITFYCIFLSLIVSIIVFAVSLYFPSFLALIFISLSRLVFHQSLSFLVHSLHRLEAVATFNVVLPVPHSLILGLKRQLWRRVHDLDRL